MYGDIPLPSGMLAVNASDWPVSTTGFEAAKAGAAIACSVPNANITKAASITTVNLTLLFMPYDDPCKVAFPLFIQIPI